MTVSNSHDDDRDGPAENSQPPAGLKVRVAAGVVPC